MKKLLLLFSLLYLSLNSLALSEKYLLSSDSEMEWFVKSKFGIFLHWGPVSLMGERLSWSRNGKRAGHIDGDTGVPADIYDNLYKKFNPQKFDADQWAELFAKSGAKYIVFTTKHHDGFCMFDAPNTNYKITNSPFKRDIAKELAQACHKKGIRVMWYYSQPDWANPDCLDKENHGRYLDYMYEHLRYLNTNYGKISGMWFDGLRTKWTDWKTPDMLKMIKTLQPGSVINSRAGRALKVKGKLIEYDFDNAELKFGKFQIDRPWEMCATMTETWGWSGGKNLKPFKNCMRMLVSSACAGGNLLLNTGPTAAGEINGPEAKILTQMGQWLEQNGESIYNTTAGPYKPGLWGGATRNANKIYLHITKQFHGVNAELNIPDPGARIIKISSPNNVKARFSQTGGRLKIKLDPSSLNEVDNIVVLELNKDALSLPVINPELPKDLAHNKKGIASTEARAKYAASNVFGVSGVEVQEGARHKLSWIPHNHDKAPWIGVDLGTESVFNQIEFREQVRLVRTRKFELQYKHEGGQWHTFYEGTNPGLDFVVQFKPIKARYVRLKFNKVDDGLPSISFFKVYAAPKSQL